MNFFTRLRMGLKIVPDLFEASLYWPVARIGLDKLTKVPPAQPTEEELFAMGVIRTAVDKVWSVLRKRPLTDLDLKTPQG